MCVIPTQWAIGTRKARVPTPIRTGTRKARVPTPIHTPPDSRAAPTDGKAEILKNVFSKWTKHDHM